MGLVVCQLQVVQLLVGLSLLTSLEGPLGLCLSPVSVRVFLLPPGWDASPSQGLPPALSSPVPIYAPFMLVGGGYKFRAWYASLPMEKRTSFLLYKRCTAQLLLNQSPAHFQIRRTLLHWWHGKRLLSNEGSIDQCLLLHWLRCSAWTICSEHYFPRRRESPCWALLFSRPYWLAEIEKVAFDVFLGIVRIQL